MRNAIVTMTSMLAAVLCAFVCYGSLAQTADDDDPTPAQQRDLARVATLVHDFERSSDLRIRILFATETDWDGKRLAFHEITPRETLVDLARGSTDPLTLSLLTQTCPPVDPAKPARAPCGAVDFARRWTEADTQNQLAWISLAQALQSAGRSDEARAAFERASAASIWHDQYNDAARLIIAALPADLSPGERRIALSSAGAKASALIPLTAMHTLGEFCKESGLAAACTRIVETMVRDSPLFVTLRLAIPFASRAHVRRETVLGYERRLDAAYWSMLHVVSPLLSDPDPQVANRAVTDLMTRGEVRQAEDALAARRIDHATAAARYVADMSPQEKEMHARWSRPQ